MPGGEPRASAYVGPIQGSLREMEFYSPALDRDVSYFIYLPPEYARAGRRYPVLYMLHSASGDKEEWLAYGLVDVADQAFKSGELEPLMIVLPQGDFSYWANHAADGPRWGDYLAADLVRHIDASYRTLRAPESRAIGGLSMGGWGALHQAFGRPDVFGIVGAHSPALRTDDGSIAFVGVGDEFARKDPLRLAHTAPSSSDCRSGSILARTIRGSAGPRCYTRRSTSAAFRTNGWSSQADTTAHIGRATPPTTCASMVAPPHAAEAPHRMDALGSAHGR
jgi:esterase/lipase superfamily enzyme